MEYGLIGAKLGHSFSQPIHEHLGGYAYTLCPLPTAADLDAFLKARAFKAVNVTIPYKQAVLPYCAQVDARAAAIGAVNTLVNRGGSLYGYNTDYAGFAYLARRTGISFAGKNVLILGTGGTQHTVRAVAADAGAARVTAASRTGTRGGVTYEEALAMADTHIVVNTTPCGMFPESDGCPIDLAPFPALEGVLDAVYNPLRTNLVLNARARGIPAAGGLPMLVAQAKYAAEIFLDRTLPEEGIEQELSRLRRAVTNLVLVGMPSSGKTSFGKAAAAALDRPFVDLDALIEQRAGKSIPDIFAAGGEEAFRALESAVCADAARQTGCVLSTGGGTVLRAENVRALRRTGAVVCLDRPLEALHVGGNRPLSVSLPALADMKNARAPFYAAASDRTVSNDREFSLVLRDILEAFDEIVDSERA